jgi:hypothetical protein
VLVHEAENIRTARAAKPRLLHLRIKQRRAAVPTDGFQRGARFPQRAGRIPDHRRPLPASLDRRAHLRNR